MNSSKHIALMSCLSKNGLNDESQRHELVFEWTNGRTSSSKLMYDYEIDYVINNLTKGFTDPAKELAALDIVKRDKRAVILAIAGRVGFFPDNSSNFDYLNAWMVKNSILKKELWKYKVDELDALTKQFRGIEAHFDKSAAVPGTKAWHIKNKVPVSSAN